MDFIETLFNILSVICVFIPLTLMVLLILYFIKKSRSDQPKHILEKEKSEMVGKVQLQK